MSSFHNKPKDHLCNIIILSNVESTEVNWEQKPGSLSYQDKSIKHWDSKIDALHAHKKKNQPSFCLRECTISSLHKVYTLTSKKHIPRTKSKHIYPETEPDSANKKITQAQSISLNIDSSNASISIKSLSHHLAISCSDFIEIYLCLIFIAVTFFSSLFLHWFTDHRGFLSIICFEPKQISMSRLCTSTFHESFFLT